MTPLALIRDYYRRIDDQDIAAVLSLFRPDAIYQRAGTRLAGEAELRRFFTQERRIRGRHDIAQLWAVGEVVIATGRFRGESGSGELRELAFADLWFFASDGLVAERQTFLAHGYSLIQD